MSAAKIHVGCFISWYFVGFYRLICCINSGESAARSENQTLTSLRIERKVGAPIFHLATVMANFKKGYLKMFEMLDDIFVNAYGSFEYLLRVVPLT